MYDVIKGEATGLGLSQFVGRMEHTYGPAVSGQQRDANPQSSQHLCAGRRAL